MIVNIDIDYINIFKAITAKMDINCININLQFF